MNPQLRTLLTAKIKHVLSTYYVKSTESSLEEQNPVIPLHIVEIFWHHSWSCYMSMHHKHSGNSMRKEKVAK